jgi:hypothetical protein
MLKLFLWTPLFLLCSAALCAEDVINPVTTDLPKSADLEMMVSNELNTLDRLIAATQRSLNTQNELRQLIQRYREAEDRYLQGPENDHDLLYAMAKLAYQILEIIQTHHLTLNFDPKFIEELAIVSKPISKRGIPKP